jgi:hypothetical protein
MQIGMDKVKLILCVDGMILYMKGPKNSIKKTFRSHKKIQQSSRTQKQYTNMGGADICQLDWSNQVDSLKTQFDY